ncbi:hypothetical protein SEUCBS139899_005609 [Sporothrix eucalyptigena]|uniref:SCP domain-containing protein n=1 Tax=Sporothrix eucalyptigena TaxID=1812306 RepID=A0ABP0C169_9PEZI
MKFSAVVLALTTSLVSASPIAQEPSRVKQDMARRAGIAISTPTDYATVAVNAHNIHRLNHSAPAVSWNTALAADAAIVAASCKFAHNQTVGGGGYGQNIASSGSSANLANDSPSKYVNQAVTDQWYNGEEPLYPAADYGKSTPDLTNFESWGHFSQVVWVASTQIGCASQYCAAGTIFPTLNSWFTVCNYQATGNVATEYGTNVLPPLGMTTITV